MILFNGRGPRIGSNEILMHTKDFPSVHATQMEPSSSSGLYIREPYSFIGYGNISIDGTNALKLREHKVDTRDIFHREA